MTPRFHGGDLHHIQQTHPEADTPWIDLSTGMNPWSYPWLEKIASADLYAASNRLPGQDDYDACRAAYARYLGCQAENLVFGAGSQALLEKIPQLFPTTTVYVLGPTYQEHGHSWSRMGHTVQYLPYTEESLNMIPPDKVIIITTPNNPDGQCISSARLFEFSKKYCRGDGILILDEAFMDLTPENSMIQYEVPDGVYILRSLGKFFGLAGLRLGVLHAAPLFCKRMKSLTALWNISTLTLTIATFALQDDLWIKTTRNTLAQKMDKLCQMVRHSGYQIVGRTNLYCLITGEDIPDLFHRLAAGGIYTRSFRDRPDFLRLGLPATPAACHRLNTLLMENTP